MIFRLFYTSRCLIVDEHEARAEAELIASRAGIKNQSVNITGAMTFDGNDFAQILEGKKADVQQLFKIIRNDPRHTQVTVIKQTHALKRHYEGWGMHALNSSNYDELVRVMGA